MIRFLLAVAQAMDPELLEQPVRRRLWDIIRNRPGIHASQLCRESGEAWGTVQYHLGLLRKVEMVTSVESGRERRFFPPGMDPERARLMSLLEQGRREEIARFILDNPGQRQVDVCTSVSVSRKTFRASVQPLVEAGLIEERKGVQTNRYYPVDELEGALSGLEQPDFDASFA
ncbi:MAG: winged helix-turn-helix transcriptional regulator [Thermoplasmatota archaeon]